MLTLGIDGFICEVWWVCVCFLFVLLGFPALLPSADFQALGRRQSPQRHRIGFA